MILGLGLVLTLILGFTGVVSTSHGHIDERLDVTVHVVDRSGQPLTGAVVATVQFEGWNEREGFDAELAEAVRLQAELGEDAMGMPVSATRVGTEAETTFIASVYVTRWWLGGLQTRMEIGVPDLLLVDHPRHGRTTIPIEEDAVKPGDAASTWGLDLGTIRIPQ